MADRSYPFRVLRHKFAKQVSYKHTSEDQDFFNGLVSAVLFAGIGFCGSYAVLDEDPSTTMPENGAETYSLMENAITDLQEQKRSLITSENSAHHQALVALGSEAEAAPATLTSAQFDQNAKTVLESILVAGQDVSEQGVESLLSTFDEKIMSTEHVLDYELGEMSYLHECHAASLTEDPNRNLSETAQDVAACTVDEQKSSAAFSLFGLFLFIPGIFTMMGVSRSSRLREWAEKEPKRNTSSSMKH